MATQHWLLILVLAYSQTLADSACPTGCRACENGQFLCSGIGLKETPRPIPEDTMIMDLSQNEIRELSKPDLERLSSVQSLRLSGNQIDHLPSRIFETMSELVSLDLSHNVIARAADDAFQGLVSLRTISLDNNNLRRIGRMLKDTQQASSITLGGNKLSSIEEDDFKENRMLRMLDLSNNRITSIHSQAFANLEMLQFLVLSNNPITLLPDLVFSSSKFSLADFSNCELTAVPRTMPPSLQDFRLGNNRITAIELEDFRNITNLRLVILNNNQISQVAHRAFWGLDNLREVWMTQNEMVYIPRGLPKSLIKLYMDFNRVSDLQPMLFPKEADLEFLTLEANQIRKVHQDAFKDVKKLTKLNLQGNIISLIDIGTFTELPDLKTLHLSNNPLQSIEAGAFANLQNLTTLMLSNIDHTPTPGVHLLKENFLTTMPKLAFMDMTASPHLAKKFLEVISSPDTPAFRSIKHINLRYNDLQSMPENLPRVVPSIKELILDGNLWRCDTNLLWLHDWMSTAGEEPRFFSIDEPTCHSPQSVEGRSVLSLGRSEFPAPVAEEAETAQDSQSESGRQRPAANTGDRNAVETQNNDQNNLQQEDHDTSSVETQRQQVFGTRVVVKAPKTSPEDDPADVEAERELKKKKRRRNKKNRKDKKKRDKLRRRDERKKRRIRNGEKKKKRCKLQLDGSLKCRRRKGKGQKKNKVTTTAVPPTIQA